MLYGQDRAEIERAFLRGHNMWEVADEYSLQNKPRGIVNIKDIRTVLWKGADVLEDLSGRNRMEFNSTKCKLLQSGLMTRASAVAWELVIHKCAARSSPRCPPQKRCSDTPWMRCSCRKRSLPRGPWLGSGLTPGQVTEAALPLAPGCLSGHGQTRYWCCRAEGAGLAPWPQMAPTTWKPIY